MPNDDLGLEPGQAVPEGEPTAPAEPTPATGPQPEAASPVTAEAIAPMIQQAMEGQNQAVVDALQNVHQLLQQQQPPPPGAPDATELAERLLTDPNAVLDEKMDEWGKKNLAAPLSRTFEVDRDERVETRSREIDEEMGPGFFNEHIRPRLTGEKGVLASWTINQQADPRIIDSAINGIMGNDFRDSEKRAVMQDAIAKTAKARQERDVQQAPHVMGPGRPRMSPTNTLTADMKYTLDGMQRVGVVISEDDLKKTIALPDHSLAAWQEATQ